MKKKKKIIKIASSETPRNDELTLTIGWLYPELMSTYGDRGNIIVLRKRCEWRGIHVDIKTIDGRSTEREVHLCDLIVGGGAQDRQQAIVISDLRERKGPILKELFDIDIPGLFVCGAPQLLGHTYQMADGTILKGLSIFDMESKHFGKDKPRCIGNLICEIDDQLMDQLFSSHSERSEESLLSEGDPSPAKRGQDDKMRNTIVGFENHGGRTYLGERVRPFAKVLFGNGNNGEDGTEGAIYKHCLATYSHGPFLSKNPHIADWLITKALEVKYKKAIKLSKLDDRYSWLAHKTLVSRFAG